MVWILAGIIIILLVVLLSPLTFAAEVVRSGGKIKGSFSAGWLMLLIRYILESKRTEVLVFRRRIASMSPKATEYKKSRRTRLHIMQIFNMIGPLLRLLKDIVSAFRLKYLDIDIMYGLDNPAYTGIFTGFLYAVRGSSRMGQDIRFVPDYTRQVLDWNIKAKASIMPVQIILPVARFVTNRQVLKSGWRFIRE